MPVKLKKTHTKKRISSHMNLINMILKLLVKNFQKKRKIRGTTKNKTTKTGHQNHINPGPGTITPQVKIIL